MSEVTIRRMVESDLEQVYKLEQECFIDPYKYEDIEYEFYKNPVNVILVACVDNKVVGFNDFMITFNSATITQICVSKEYRNRGIALSLLKEMENTFPKDGEEEVETVTLEVRKSNVPALSLYTKDGYEVVVAKPHYYKDGEDAVYMVKRLLKWR